MNKIIIFFALFFASMLYAQDGPKYTWFTPCSNWQATPTGGYTCSYLGWQINIYDTREIDQIVTKLEQRIADLEARVQKLEAQHP